MAMHQQIPDAQVAALVRRCQCGETAGIEGLYQLYAGRLYRYMLLRVGNADVAADLTTELFLTALQHMPAFRLNHDRPAASVSAWFYRVAANLVAGHFKRQRRHPALSLDDIQDEPAVIAGPERAAERREMLAELAGALERLSEDQRLVLIGRFTEDMSLSEVAAWLGKTEGAVKSLQHRALRALARRLGIDEEEVQRQPWISYAEP